MKIEHNARDERKLNTGQIRSEYTRAFADFVNSDELCCKIIFDTVKEATKAQYLMATYRMNHSLRGVEIKRDREVIYLEKVGG